MNKLVKRPDWTESKKFIGIDLSKNVHYDQILNKKLIEIQSKNKLTVAVVYAARSSQMAAMASPTNSPPSCSPPEVTGVANAQKVLLTGFPGVAKAAVENAARQTAMPL